MLEVPQSDLSTPKRTRKAHQPRRRCAELDTVGETISSAINLRLSVAPEASCHVRTGGDAPISLEKGDLGGVLSDETLEDILFSLEPTIGDLLKTPRHQTNTSNDIRDVVGMSSATMNCSPPFSRSRCAPQCPTARSELSEADITSAISSGEPQMASRTSSNCLEHGPHNGCQLPAELPGLALGSPSISAHDQGDAAAMHSAVCAAKEVEGNATRDVVGGQITASGAACLLGRLREAREARVKRRRMEAE